MATPPRPPPSSLSHPSSHGRGTALSRPQSHNITRTQQSPSAKSRLSSLAALINRNEKDSRQNPAMAEALLGLAPSSYGDALSDKFSIAKPEDLPAQLQQDLETKRTPTRCEHVSVTLDVPSTVEFAIRESDGDAQENIDPALSGFRSQTVEGQQVKVVRAYDAIIQQPHDNPAMQRAVAKHIVALLSTVDERFDGHVESPKRKDRIQVAHRRVQPTGARSCYLRPPSFRLPSTLTIAFSKNSRTINVKYEHSPLHKTVGEMIERFRPLPPAPPPVPLIPAGDKKKTPRKRKVEYNEDGTPKEPKRKRKSAAVNEDGTPAQPKKKRKKKSDANAAEASADGAGAADSTVMTKADAAVQSNLHSQANLNVPPAEAARRREVAIRMLSDNGVYPETLSTEQFSIFANQSPDLQKESLSMLVKYGAERLRIVHPNDAAASSSTSASSTPPQPAVLEEPAASSESETPTKAKKKASRKSKSTTELEEELVPAPGDTPMKMISRGSCIGCRIGKLKCDRTKPTCDVCEEEGRDCQYPLVKSAATKKKSTLTAVQVVSDDEDDAEADAEPEPEPDDIETIDYTSNMPVANMLTPAADTSTQDYFNSGPSDLTYGQGSSNDMGLSHAVNTYPEPSATVSFTDQHAVTSFYTQPALTQTANYTQPTMDTTSYTQPAVAETVSYTQPAAKSPKASRTSTATRRSLPSGARTSTTESAVPLPSYAQNWATSPPKAPANTVSPTMTTRQQPRSSSRRSTQTPVQAATQQSSFNTTQQTAAHAAIQQQQQQHRPSPTPQVAQSVTPAQVSPFQAPVQTARAKSRAGRRASTRTPVNTDPRPTPSHHTVQQSTTVDTQPMGNVSGYSNYNTKYSATSNNNAASDTRLAYEPYTAQTTSATTSTYTSYDNTYDRSSTAQNTNIAYTPTNNSRSSQYQTRSSQSYNNTTPAASSYSQTPTTTQQQTASLQSFNMRASAAGTHTRSSSNKYQQQQQQPSQQQQPQQTQSYGSYSSQTQQQSAQPDQHSWYGFGSSTTSSTPANAAGGYGTRSSTSNSYGSGTANASQAYQQQQHYGGLNMSGHNYTGTDNEMYELLKLHKSGR
ncbi:unnamed protein product [Colletotrichum noveboracense]|uniref:Zn(2)-C6 fungal-type domain-containing protein n=1 Tax=Colletotrichum noveboracense TaxID=2664923 RepID=A0A9W4RG37_9PEZI|nr:unnamed protein product [Colletotrichum noveboracense]